MLRRALRSYREGPTKSQFVAALRDNAARNERRLTTDAANNKIRAT